MARTPVFLSNSAITPASHSKSSPTAGSSASILARRPDVGTKDHPPPPVAAAEKCVDERPVDVPCANERRHTLEDGCRRLVS